MKTSSMVRLVFGVVAALFLAGCKIEIYVPDGGAVVTTSGDVRCEAGQICRLDVNDLFFEQVFTALPAEGFTFVGWRTRDRGLCGGSVEACHLTTAGMEGNASLMAVLESDEVFYLEPVFEATAPFLLLYGGDEQQFYLGCLNCPGTFLDSVCNANGNHGAALAHYSIWNAAGDFGSLVTNYSPWNIFATAAPVIRDTDGQFYGYLTANVAQPGRTTLPLLVQLTNYAADPQYSLPAVRDWFCN